MNQCEVSKDNVVQIWQTHINGSKASCGLDLSIDRLSSLAVYEFDGEIRLLQYTTSWQYGYIEEKD